VCDLETSRMGAPYIYDISRLRVKQHRCENLKYCKKKDVLRFSEWADFNVPKTKIRRRNTYKLILNERVFTVFDVIDIKIMVRWRNSVLNVRRTGFVIL